jgi:hypothetical protein
VTGLTTIPLAHKFAHWRVYSLPHDWVVALLDGYEFPDLIDRDSAILAWSGHASDESAAIRAAF